jgi:tetratricopeptide (TPR) repeat protein
VARHIGYLQESGGEIEPARASFRDSLELRQRNDMNVFVPFAMILLADFEDEQKHSAQAIHYAEQAIQLAKSGNSPRALYSAHLTLAKLYFENGKTTEARQLAEQSRAEAEAFGSAEDAKEAEDFLQKHP